MLFRSEVALEQQAVIRVRPGQKARVSFESIRNEKFVASVESVYPRDNAFIVKMKLDRVITGILPGMTADVAIEVGRKDDALLVPVRALSAGKVTLVRDGRRTKVDVKLGVVDKDWAEVSSGEVREGDLLLVRSK